MPIARKSGFQSISPPTPQISRPLDANRELIALGVKDTMARVAEVRTFFDWSEAKEPVAVTS